MNELTKDSVQQALMAHYKFDDTGTIGKDSSGAERHAVLAGSRSLPSVGTVAGRKAVTLKGGSHGSSYLQLPSRLLDGAGDHTGLTVAAWVYFGQGASVWERIFDFGAGPQGPYLFLTRNLRGVCFAGSDLAADAGKSFPAGQWLHIALSVSGTKGGTASSAGPVLYVNGELAADGSISQTSSGAYAKLREWFASFAHDGAYSRNYIGKSQYDADADFSGSLSDFRVYRAGLTQDEVIDVMCESLSEEEIVKLAAGKYLSLPSSIVTADVTLPASLMGGKAAVAWHSSNPEALGHDGSVGKGLTAPQAVTLTARLTAGEASAERSFELTVLPEGIAPYTVTVHGDRTAAEISPVMYGLFYEDINNAADGGIYAELVQNRSFEAFAYDSFSHVCGENAVSTGRRREPLFAWSGDTGKMKVRDAGGLNEHFGIADPDVNSRYVTVESGAVIRNKGYGDSNGNCAMAIRHGARYRFTVWAKAETDGEFSIQLQDAEGRPVSDEAVVRVKGGGEWNKYGENGEYALTGTAAALGQLVMTFAGEISIDMVSLMPEEVWGAGEEERSATAHANFKGNPNYRLRRDLVEALLDLHPKFLRFPGGCISEGSHVWDNVYDWKHSVGSVERRKENYNVWGYMMTLGLGYMEYFQLAEDLGALPLPVMACGVLCQARSDYANPAGGALRGYYIRNFTDLIDFAISTDFEGNEWAALRKSMGHEAPFDLRYLGVGNENWGTEFFANFEIFKAAIDEYMARHYPDHELHIISTVGAQADDDAYQQGWKFLSGHLKGSAVVRFTDGCCSTEETVTWYGKQRNYMDTIADEHYYRSNDYLLNNADRYNYYYRAYQPDGTLDEAETSKVFVGEYASTDKNTLAGAVAEAAVMTGFENNADVVRLAAYAPLFNKVLTDGTYRWTPDCIWFDDETVWFTPNYYVQQMFARYIGDKLLETSFTTYRKGKREPLIPRGGIQLAAGDAEIVLKRAKVTSNHDGSVLLEQDFTQSLHPAWQWLPGSAGGEAVPGEGLLLKAQAGGRNGLYLLNDEWTNYKVEVTAVKRAGKEGFFIGAGVTDVSADGKDMLEYAIGMDGNATGVKVYKQGVEGYTLGDYSSSKAAGNLRDCCFEELETGTDYTITVNHGGESGSRLICFYTSGDFVSKVHDYKLEAYNRDVFHSVTRDGERLYVKLVNADAVAKPTRVELKDLAPASACKLVTLTGDPELVRVPNVNRKNDEKVRPTESVPSFEDSAVTVTLPPHSVQVLVWELEAAE